MAPKASQGVESGRDGKSGMSRKKRKQLQERKDSTAFSPFPLERFFFKKRKTIFSLSFPPQAPHLPKGKPKGWKL